MIGTSTSLIIGWTAHDQAQRRNIMAIDIQFEPYETHIPANHTQTPNPGRAQQRKLVAYEYVTLDGVMESPEAWQFPYFSDDVADFIKTQILEFDAILLGSATYEIFAANWPQRTHNEFGIADKLNRAPKFVVSSKLAKADWNNTTLIKGKVASQIAKLKRQPGGDIALIGSATLLQSLMESDLIDEYRLLVHPIVMGQGKHLFNDVSLITSLKLVETSVFSSGVVLLRYQPDGDKHEVKSD
jgi:dihydrofolate reductase